MTTEEDRAWERYRHILEIIERYAGPEKKTYLTLVYGLLSKCVDYVKMVIEFEALERFGRYELDGDIYKKEIASLDTSRRIAHDALISDLHIVNRALFSGKNLRGKIPIGGIYSLDPDTIRNRDLVAQWAGLLVRALARRGMVRVKQQSIYKEF